VAVMLFKFFVTDDMLREVQADDDAFKIWGHLKNMHNTSDKYRVFFLKEFVMFDKDGGV
jgi:hypothetical protein